MQQYNCIIVEDEPLAAEVLQDYITQVSFLQLKATCPDAIFALDILQKEKIDVIFLDIHLPKLKGLDFIKTLKHPPNVIITTAYHEYALQGYEFKVIDYLLKSATASKMWRSCCSRNTLSAVIFPRTQLFSHTGSTCKIFFV